LLKRPPSPGIPAQFEAETSLVERASRRLAALEAKAPHSLAYLYMGGLVLLYILVSLHTPLNVLANGVHDDGLFMSLGTYLSEGRWLGPFNQFTLMKGPGYPVFLAFNNWLGTPISLSHAVLHCVAVVCFVFVAHRFIRSIFLSGLLFTLLLWHPVSLSIPLLRVLRDRIYFDELLILLATLALTLFNGIDRKHRVTLAILGGAVLGWFWLTREEGVWILPALGVMVAAAAFHAYRHQRVRELAGTVLIVVGVFAATQVGFRASNWWNYGKFVGVDFKEANFQRALGALDSVRSGGTKPFVSITYKSMSRVCDVSPTFASLAPYLNGPERDWEAFGCAFYPSTCGEISSGWFMWALRDSAEHGGHFSSPSESSAFFGRIADEVEAACKRGTLQCKRQLIAEMPPMSLHRLAEGLRGRYAEALNLLLLLDFPIRPDHGSFLSSVPVQSGGTKDVLAKRLRFLNYPLHTRSSDWSPMLTSYVISGWYYGSGSDWISVAVRRSDGSVADVRFDRGTSPDIAAHFGDPLASLQRYRISVDCNDECVLQVRTPAGQEASETFAELLRRAPFGFAAGSGTFFADSAIPVPEAEYEPTLADGTADHIRKVIFGLYKYVLVPLLLMGVIAFVTSSVVYWQSALRNVCYVLALVSWSLVLSRVGLLLLTAATSLPALMIHYMAPAYFMLVSGAVFSCAAWLQLSRPLGRAC
jgi:hypothetical protein